MKVEAVALADFVHGDINAIEGRVCRHSGGDLLDSGIAGDLERAGLVRIRIAPAATRVPAAEGKVADDRAGSTVVCIASGPSLTEDDVRYVEAWKRKDPQSRRVIIVNTSFRLATWADVLYAPDLRWWRVYGAEAEQRFTGERWTCAVNVDGANYIEAVDDPGLCLKPDRIHVGGNGGYQAIGLAFMWGAVRIILLGYDMQRGPKGESHHHGDHGNGLPNCPAENLAEWARRMVQLGIDLRTRGVEVINATRRTALKCFEKAPIEQALYPGDPPAIVRGARAALLIPHDLLPREHAAFRAGLAAAGYREGAGQDLSVIWGTYRGEVTGVALVAENGYLDGQGGPYVALAVGGHNGSGRWPEGSSARFERLGVAVRRWRTKGGHILVCPGRGMGYPAAMRQPAGWTERTVAELRRHTDREIRVRPHPGQWKLRASEVEASLRADLEGAHACIIWASSAGIRALTMGIPVMYNAPAWICAEAAGNDLAQIEDPPMPERMPVFNRLASAQWTLEEISSGAAICALLEQDLTRAAA